MRDSAPRTAPSLTYRRSGTAVRPEAGHGIGTAAARAAPPCPGRSLLRLAASRSKSPRPTFSAQGWLPAHGSAPSLPAPSPDARGPPPAASGPLRPPWGAGLAPARGGAEGGARQGRDAFLGPLGPARSSLFLPPQEEWRFGDGSGHG